MKDFWDLITILLVFAFAIYLGYALYDAEKQQKHVGESVVVNGDTLKIVEWTEFNHMYVLENGLVFKYKDYENRNEQED